VLKRLAPKGHGIASAASAHGSRPFHEERTHIGRAVITMGRGQKVTADGLCGRVEGPISLCEAIALDGPLAASLQRLYDSIPTALGVIGRDGRYLSANSMYAAIYDASPQQVVGCPVSDYVQNADEQLREDFTKFDAGVGMIEREIACRGRYYLEALQPLHGSGGRVLGLTLSLVDITARKRMEQALEKVSRDWQFRASHDHLTSLPNRRHVDRALAAESRRSARTGLPLSLLMIDVDFFKKYNDHVGHQPGDDCLRAIAAQLRGLVRREGDLVGRYGGEEFVAILAGADASSAHGIAESMRRAVQELDIEHPLSPYGSVTLSIGVATLRIAPGDVRRSCDELLGNADQALYSAKAAGRNAVHAHPQKA
jgi:diguanylate cyclase (GGDEF)-like protein/PAS domain S-box-containing protein